jgi:hypothetical protein
MKIFRTLVSSLVAFSASISLSGCGILLGIKHPTVEGSLVEGKKRAALIERLHTDSKLPPTVKTMTRVTLKKDSSTESFRYSLVFSAPSSVRVDVFPINAPFTLQRLTASNGKATLIDRTSKETISGDTAEIFGKSFLQLPATEQELASLLMGRIPPEYLDDEKLRIYQGASSVTGIKGDGELFWKMNLKTLQMEEVQLREKITGRLIVVAKYGALISCGKFFLPGNVTIDIPIDGTSLELTHNNPACSVPVRSDIFKLGYP